MIKIFYKDTRMSSFRRIYMFEEKKKLIIVCTPETKVYAYQLLQLIGEKDDTETEIVGCKDGSVQAAIWEEKYYLSNECQLFTQ